ncbi:MAG: C39 family peptidase [Pseudomonadales bacterium]|jgi:hypothetical protein|nr:C39 family peptidase [Pseudomonadales bacterium]MDP6471341.1 C39 family peptidase [Pseudomonadales bacterium]MDP6826468.1 C39 family peptidase [Pseudomonadales bacterium]MDP6970077.1 C39 family peptidase [Pseudomonadales bacterium]|tara:strand:+ start:1888 stop:2841 length:954 start_codon:yes stop_codon:yes gene_type:complete
MLLHSVRYADELTAGSFPLEVAGPAGWVVEASDRFSCTIRLPPIPEHHIVIPSFASAASDTRFVFSLLGDAVAELPGVPTTIDGYQTANTPTNSAGAVSMHIDCWHTEQPCVDTKVRLVVHASCPPKRYLLTISIRPLEIDPPITACTCRITTDRAPAGISQMQAPPRIRSRICSPTAMAMVIGCKGRDERWRRLVERCYDPRTRLYGVWPLALRAATLEGHLGSVEALADWDVACRLLERGVALVTSIKFAKGQLTGAPLEYTCGHLVVLYGIEHQEVLVCDPAAPEDMDVRKRYDITEFSRAWLAYRGATYIVPV